MSTELQTYVISKRIELKISAWSRFVEFLKLFYMLTDFKQKVKVVYKLLINIERLVFFFATVKIDNDA